MRMSSIKQEEESRLWEGERAEFNQANTYESGVPASGLYTHPQAASIPALVSHSYRHRAVRPPTLCNTYPKHTSASYHYNYHHRVVNNMIASKSAGGATGCGEESRAFLGWWEWV